MCDENLEKIRIIFNCMGDMHNRKLSDYLDISHKP